MAHSRANIGLSKGKIEPVAGNGLLDRRALLGRGVAFAGALGTGSGIPRCGPGGGSSSGTCPWSRAAATTIRPSPAPRS